MKYPPDVSGAKTASVSLCTSSCERQCYNEHRSDIIQYVDTSLVGIFLLLYLNGKVGYLCRKIIETEQTQRTQIWYRGRDLAVTVCVQAKPVAVNLSNIKSFLILFFSHKFQDLGKVDLSYPALSLLLLMEIKDG